MGPSLRVLLAEDHPLVRESIARLLCTSCTIAGSVDRGDLVLEAVERLKPDAVVLDISLPGRSGLQLLPDLRFAHSELLIILLTNHDSPAYREAAKERGADAYVLKQNAASDLLPALRSAAEGHQRANSLSSQLKA